MKFLGHVISSKGINVAHDKIDAVKLWPKLETVRNVQAFLGVANFYQRFIKGFAGIARPLMDLMHKDVPFQWDHDQDAAFKALKHALTKVPILQVYDDELKHEVWVDASDYAVGATLVQEVSGSSGQWLPVEYMSHRLSAAKQNYHANDREFVAILSALHCWCHFLIG